MKPSYIKIPVTILVPRKPGKQDSIFYGVQPIAQVTINNRKYILTTAGEYKFFYKDKKGTWQMGHQNSPIVSRWTNRDIKNLDHNRVDNWGWFGINIWTIDPQTKQERFLDGVNDVWSEYDEAMTAFINYVERNITNA